MTPEQRKVVQQILAAKSFYEVMGVSRDAGDADIKSAYKKVSRGVGRGACSWLLCVTALPPMRQGVSCGNRLLFVGCLQQTPSRRRPVIVCDAR